MAFCVRIFTRFRDLIFTTQASLDMAFQVDGKLHKVFNTEQKTEKFRAREFVIEIVDGNYPEMIKFQLTQDKCEMIDDYNEGDQITVHFNLRGREWNDRYFTNLDAWRLEGAGKSQAAPAGPAGAVSDNDYPELTKAPAADFSDDIPF